MKVTLIQPGSPASGITGAFFFRNIPSQGLIQLEALTPPSWDVQTINENVETIDFDAPTDVVGITALTSLAPRAYQIAQEYCARGVPVIMGGIHASVYPEEAAQHVDCVVVGEADEIWPNILNDVAAGTLQPLYHAQRPTSLDFTFQRRPNRTKTVRISRLFPVKSTYTYYQTGRGCPIGCEFCSVAEFNGKKMRKRRIPELIADIKIELQEHDVDYLVFMDDNIIGDKTYARELFTALIPLNIKWMSQTDIRIADPDITDLAVESGLTMVFLGLESIDPETLAHAASTIKERWRNKYEPAIQALHDTAIFYILTPLPGTRFFSRLEAEKRILTRNWREYDVTYCVFNPDGTKTPHDVEDEASKAHQYFYSLSSIIRRVFRSHSWKNLALSLFMNYDFRIHGMTGLH
ncbi:MAG: cobalamin-dependent protein [Sedimentisphaerales bacterium]